MLWLVVGPIKDAGAGFSLLQQAGKSLRFISNNPMRSDEDYITKLASLGIHNLSSNDFIHPDKTIQRYLSSDPKYKRVYLITASPLKNALRGSGFIVEDGVSFKENHNSSNLNKSHFSFTNRQDSHLKHLLKP